MLTMSALGIMPMLSLQSQMCGSQSTFPRLEFGFDCKGQQRKRAVDTGWQREADKDLEVVKLTSKCLYYD